ncbi:MAG: leucyl/phenylalanyl-tRNA--protein transferase [Pyrinomonadaceae bacterium]|nr:leucyl/phenylalanyl-tRNA--protein transferase [Pyrinomonadaceae bacterium]
MVFPDPANYEFPWYVRIGDYNFPSFNIVAFGVPLTAENVLEAHGKGIFPWYVENVPLPWHCPEERALLDLERITVPRSLAKVRRKAEFTFTIDAAFEQVIRECSLAPRPGQHGTWITDDFIRVYTELHKAGPAHSVEAWDRSGRLVGGLYGVESRGYFSGESMFHKRSNASKLALLHLIDHLSERGARWLDIQVMTPHMKALGAIDVPRQDFLTLIEEADARRLRLFGE